MYRLVFSKLWYSDLDSSYKYISETLERPMAADNLIIESKKKLVEIMNNPTHRPLVNDKYLANLGYRLKKVNNYMTFYIIDNDNKHIKIVRFLYCKRDWMTILKEKTVEEMMEESWCLPLVGELKELIIEAAVAAITRAYTACASHVFVRSEIWPKTKEIKFTQTRPKIFQSLFLTM